MVKMIVSDMDGTLLDSNKNFPPDFDQIFQELKKRGILFVAASGRSYPKQREIFQPYLEDMFFICDNGASIIHHDQWLYKNTLPREKLEKLLTACEQIPNILPILCAPLNCYYQPYSPAFEPYLRSYFSTGNILNDVYSVSEPILKVAICDLQNAAVNSYPKLKHELDDELNLVVSGELWMDAMNPFVNKGKALQFLQKKFSISPAQTMVFGDFYNDIEMLTRADYSFVMENANDDMKQYGRWIAPSNDHYGVTREIWKYLSSADCFLT